MPAATSFAVRGLINRSTLPAAWSRLRQGGGRRLVSSAEVERGPLPADILILLSAFRTPHLEWSEACLTGPARIAAGSVHDVWRRVGRAVAARVGAVVENEAEGARARARRQGLGLAA